MLFKITRINRIGEERECVIETNEILGITQTRKQFERLYNENGDLVQENELPSSYEIIFDKFTTKITEETYNKLLAKLNVETL